MHCTEQLKQKSIESGIWMSHRLFIKLKMLLSIRRSLLHYKTDFIDQIFRPLNALGVVNNKEILWTIAGQKQVRYLTESMNIETLPLQMDIVSEMLNSLDESIDIIEEQIKTDWRNGYS